MDICTFWGKLLDTEFLKPKRSSQYPVIWRKCFPLFLLTDSLGLSNTWQLSFNESSGCGENPYLKEAALSQIPGLHPLPCMREFLGIPELQEPGPCTLAPAAPSHCAFRGGAHLGCGWGRAGGRSKPFVNSGKPQLLQQQPLGGCCSWRQFWTVWSSSELLSGVPAGPCLGWKVQRFLRILVLLWEVVTKHLP